MARSAHAYVRGNTLKFYEWLDSLQTHTLPEGPSIWICGDCHVGNLGPIASAEGKIDIQIRDLDQTVIGNPAHDLIRLGLSLATAARGSDLPGVTTARMLERMIGGYEAAFTENNKTAKPQKPQSVQLIIDQAAGRSWKNLARERIQDTTPTIPLGKKFWPLSKQEQRDITALFEEEVLHSLATSLRSRKDGAPVRVLDSAYWMKGCSSLGLLRYAVLLSIGGKPSKGGSVCLMDIKEAVQAAAPRYADAKMPRDNAIRIVEGARHLSPHLGDRMRAVRVQERAVFVRELLPQDLKLDIEHLTSEEAITVAEYLANVIGKAHARQMDSVMRKDWRLELRRNRSKKLDAPSWLWSSIVELITSHEGGYLEHCRRYAMGKMNTAA